MKKYEVDPEFYKLYPLFKAKLFHVKKIDDFAFQTMDQWGSKGFAYDWKTRALTKDDVERHFYHDKTNNGNKWLGSCLGFRTYYGAEKIVKRVCIDIDTIEVKEHFYKEVLPEFDKLGIDYIIEHGGDPVSHPLFPYDRCHWSFLTEAPFELTTAFMRQFFGYMKEPILAKDEKLFGKKRRYDEVYGANKAKEALRFPHGYHLKRSNRYDLQYQGEMISGAVDVMSAFIGMKPVLKEFMEEYIKEEIFPAKEEENQKIYQGYEPSEFIYNNLNLPLPVSDLPSKVRPVFRNCQALNSLLTDAYEEKTLDKRGFDIHEQGFALAGVARSHDILFSIKNGKEWFHDKLLKETRLRDAGSHHWWHGQDLNYEVYTWKCETYEDRFGACDGCAYKGVIRSPRQFLTGSPISRTPTRTDNRLVTLDQVRGKTFPAFKETIKQAYINQEYASYLIASVMSTGKSYMVRELVKEMVELYGINIMISVPTAKLALEYKKWFDDNGLNPFVHMSHAATFGHQANPPKEVSLVDYNCLYYNEIQSQAKVGVTSDSYKKEFCKGGCPLLETCHYPNQYKDVMDENYNVVIIQHAHMSCQEIIFKLLKKNFAMLVVDETFIENTYAYIEIDPVEIEWLEGHGEEWTYKLAKWLQGKEKATGKLSPTKEDFESIHNVFLGINKTYRVPDLVRYYNQHRLVNKDTGIEIVYELPKVPIRVFTDGTPPIDLIKELTGVKNLKVIGDNEVLDIKAIHPDNERIQLIDANTSVTKLNDNEYFELMLTKICEIIKRDYFDKKTLITCYKKDIPRVRGFIEERCPEILKCIDTAVISKGTNQWADFDCQFILAGRYRSGIEYLKDVYKYKAVSNYYRLKNSQPLLPNVFHKDISQSSSINKVAKKVTALVKTSSGLKEMVFNDLVNYESGLMVDGENIKQTNPINNYTWYSWMDDLDCGEMMQAERTRPNSTRPITIYHCHNRRLKKLLMTKLMTTQEFLAS